MRHRLLAVLAVGLLVAAAAPQGDAVKADLDKLQGEWQIQSIEVAGMPLKGGLPGKVTIKGDKIDFPLADTAIKLMPDQKPKAIDLLRASDGRKWLGVYTLDGDELKLCMAMVEQGKLDDQKRPADFDKTKVQMIIIAKRVKG